jgi:hypothetical protein
METTAFPITKDQASELYGYCTIILDHLRPFLNTDPLTELHSEEMYMTLINTKPLLDEILQTPEQKFDALSEALKKKYNPLINQPIPIPEKSSLFSNDNFIEQYKEIMNDFVNNKNKRFETVLNNALSILLEDVTADGGTKLDLQGAINTAFFIAGEVEVKYQELDDLKKQVQHAE